MVSPTTRMPNSLARYVMHGTVVSAKDRGTLKCRKTFVSQYMRCETVLY